MLEVEVIGDGGPEAPPRAEVERLVGIAFGSVGVDDGHVAIEYVEPDRIAALNHEFRGKTGPTDVLSFPIDADGPVAGPRDLREAVLHGALHLTGMDHETDEGEMLALQAELLNW